MSSKNTGNGLALLLIIALCAAGYYYRKDLGKYWDKFVKQTNKTISNIEKKL